MLPIEKLLPRARRFYGEREAVADSDGWMTYSELGKRVDALSAAFRRLGQRQGDRIAILDTNSRQYLEVYYAAAQSGLILVPMNSRLSAPEIQYIVNDCQARVLVYAASFTDLVISIRPRLTNVESLIRFGDGLNVAGSIAYEGAIAEGGPLCAPPLINPTDIAQIYYTSGTTGEPKGVALTYGNMAHSAVDAVVGLGLTWRDTWMHAAPLFHLVDAWAVWAMPLLGGRQSVLHFDPDKALRFIEQTKSTASGLPPTLVNMIANHPRINDFDLSSMRLIMYGGSPMPMGILTNAVAKLPIHFAHAYGITETSGITTLLRTETPSEILDKAGSAGQSVPSVAVEIRDDYGHAVPTGQIGEVVVTGPRVMTGYWGKQAETEKVLVAGAYHTGDLGRLDEDGNLALVDRKKDMIISGGENVYSAEVENVISALPGIAEVAVIGIPNATWGEAVHAVVVCDRGTNLNESELIAWCRGRIASYKIPKSVTFSNEPLPKTGPGKIAKRRLRDRYWQNQPSKI